MCRPTALAWASLLAWVFGVGGEAAWAQAGKRAEPALTIPWCKAAPTIDGRLDLDEWQFAAAVSLLEEQGSGGHGIAGVVRQEQPVFYVFRDRDHLYVAMDSLDSNTNTIVAACVQHDSLKIIGDDCLELMIGPGSGEATRRFDFPIFYVAVNAIGTVWDAKFVPRCAETHNSWESGIQTASRVEGTRWTCEMRLPFAAIRRQAPADGETWRMNFDRTYFGYNWSVWNAQGDLNSADSGGDVTFDSRAAAVRLTGSDRLVDGRVEARFEVANATDRPQTVTLTLECTGRHVKESDAVDFKAQDRQTVTVAPGQVQHVILGKKEEMLRYNRVTLQAADAEGRRLFFLERHIWIPSQRFVKRVAPEVPLVYVFPRFLPSLERLAVVMDYTAWTKKTGFAGEAPTADIKVWAKGQEKGPPVLAGTFREFKNGRGTWRHSTADLPEGSYVVKVRITGPGDMVLADHDDWFEKRIFDWMKHPRGQGEAVPAPYTALVVEGATIRPWGRSYTFAPSGLPRQIVSQGKSLLYGEATLVAHLNGRPADLTVAQPFAVTSAKPAEVRGASVLTAGPLRLEVRSTTEYDGFVLFRLTYGPAAGSVQVDRLRVRVPLEARYARFFSASGDRLGTSILGDVVPSRQGLVFDSKTNTYAVGCSPTFATLYWVGDYETCFCYAADNDQGWTIRDDAPALEVYREGDALVMWLNVVDRPIALTEARTAEFGFQAGPVKPLPPGWRGIQRAGDPDDAPITIRQIGGSGNALHGGTHSMHPGSTPQAIERSRQRILQESENGRYAVVGYHYWPTFVKGFPEARVFRGEWGIDKATWDACQSVRDWEWQSRWYGEDRDAYRMLFALPVKSYVDFITYAYDECLKHTGICGFYDDTGYPKAVFDEELGYGFVRDDGRQVWSSGLWVYRERWKRAAYVNFLHGRPNYLCDSQHVNAHWMPAYGWIGLWAPCEHGYYNPFADRDNLEFYGSIERYYAFNPSHAFGQVATIGLSTPQWEFGLQVRDTRCMMMLTLLHDQGLESWGHREQRTMCRLRQARNVFKPWEPDVTFTGFWKSADVVKAAPADIRVSLYRRPGSVLFVVGNIGERAAARVTPDWSALGLAVGGLALVDPETGRPVPVDGTGFLVDVPRHDVRLVLAGDLKRYAWQPADPGAGLPRPATVLAELSDRLAGPDLPAGWVKGLHKGRASVGFVDGRLYLQGNRHGFAHVRRPLGVDNVSVQCLVLGHGGLMVCWPNGRYVRIDVDPHAERFVGQASGTGRKSGSPINKRPCARWWPFAANGLKISLSPTAAIGYSSADGRTWVKEFEVKRGPELAGAPAAVLLGYGREGPEPFLMNAVAPAHFSLDRADQVMFFSDFIVGRE